MRTDYNKTEINQSVYLTIMRNETESRKSDLLAIYLCMRRCRDLDTDICDSLSRETLHDVTKVTRPRVNTALKELESLKIIHHDYKLGSRNKYTFPMETSGQMTEMNVLVYMKIMMNETNAKKSDLLAVYLYLRNCRDFKTNICMKVGVKKIHEALGLSVARVEKALKELDELYIINKVCGNSYGYTNVYGFSMEDTSSSARRFLNKKKGNKNE